MNRRAVGIAVIAGLGLGVAFGAVAVANQGEPVAAVAKKPQKPRKPKKVKVKNGSYGQTIKHTVKTGGGSVEVKETGRILTRKGKITDVAWSLLFLDPDGYLCESSILPPVQFPNPVYNYLFQPKKPVAPNRQNRFSFKGKPHGLLKGTIKGRFLTAKKATFTITVKEGNCTGKMTFKKAKHKPNA